MEKFRKIEFWIVTGIYLLFVFGLFIPALYHGTFAWRGGFAYTFERLGVYYDPFIHHMLPRFAVATAGYLVFLGINNWTVPQFLEKRRYWGGVPLIIAFLLLFFFTAMIASTWYYGFMLGQRQLDSFYRYCTVRALGTTLLGAILYGFYYALKYVYIHFIHDRIIKNEVWTKIPMEAHVISALWLAGIIVMNTMLGRSEYWLMFWMGPVLIINYMVLLLYVYPYFRNDGRWFGLTLRLVFINVVLSTLGMIGFVMTRRYGGAAGAVWTIYMLSQLGVAPIAWWVYKLRLSQKNEVLNLEKALGRSSANLDFLRSQINPHFLFNALNTLYGTALQENAPRTSEGVQRLGDMMRFMLHENHLEKIELSKEVAYLQNYISLQRLRTQTSEDIKIEVNISEDDCDHLIAPMLLIPFVENAFKHGISLRKRSWIVVSLSCDSKHIYFDVYNSVHPRPENDPERASLGIGLNNVKNRLQLLYPRMHELNIRQTGTEFFVHLTIQINK